MENKTVNSKGELKENSFQNLQLNYFMKAIIYSINFVKKIVINILCYKSI